MCGVRVQLELSEAMVTAKTDECNAAADANYDMRKKMKQYKDEVRLPAPRARRRGSSRQRFCCCGSFCSSSFLYSSPDAPLCDANSWTRRWRR